VEGIHNLLSTGQGRACVRRRRWSWRRRRGRRFRRGRFGHKETQNERTRHDRGSLALLRSAGLHRSEGMGVPAYLLTVPLLRPASASRFRVPLPRPTSASLQFTSPHAIGPWAVFYWLTVSLHRLTVGLLLRPCSIGSLPSLRLLLKSLHELGSLHGDWAPPARSAGGTACKCNSLQVDQHSLSPRECPLQHYVL
jgi:hypothetical protein